MHSGGSDAWRKTELIQLLQKARLKTERPPPSPGGFGTVESAGVVQKGGSEESKQLRQQLVAMQLQLDEATAAMQDEVLYWYFQIVLDVSLLAPQIEKAAKEAKARVAAEGMVRR
jgi:hypothetical protein